MSANEATRNPDILVVKNFPCGSRWSRAPRARAVWVPWVGFTSQQPTCVCKPMQVKRASAWLVARRVPPKQRCGIGWTLGPPRSPSSRPAAWEPALRPKAPWFWVAGATGVGRRRGGGALIGLYLSFLWESSFLFLVFSMVFSLAWWRYFLGFCYGESTG